MDQITVDQFITDHGLSGSFTEVYRPNLQGWPKGTRSYEGTLWCGGMSACFDFHQEPGIKQAPKVQDLVNCLIQDAFGFLNEKDFNGWCHCYYGDPDTMEREEVTKAHRTYMAVKSQSVAFLKILGMNQEEAIDAFCEVEPL